MHTLRPLLVVVTITGLPAWVQGQPPGSEAEPSSHMDVAPTREVGQYAGVVPGSGQAPPRAGVVEHSRARLLTWPGFQFRDDGASRFFLQTNGPVDTQVRTERGRFVLVLTNTRLHLPNNRRPLLTRFFNTPASSAHVERHGRDLHVVFDLRSQVEPRVTTEEAANGYWYVFIEFPAGDYLPAEMRTNPSAPAEALPPEPFPEPDASR